MLDTLLHMVETLKENSYEKDDRLMEVSINEDTGFGRATLKIDGLLKEYIWIVSLAMWVPLKN